MTQKRLTRFVRHSAFAGLGVSIWAIATFALVYGDSEERVRLAIADDPVKITDRALDVAFNPEVAERGIRSALVTRKINEAQSFAALAASRNVPLDPALAGELKHATSRTKFSCQYCWPICARLLDGRAYRHCKFHRHCVWRYVPIRRYSRRSPRRNALFGRPRDYDPWILGLAGIGIISTAARRTNQLNPSLVARRSTLVEAATAETAWQAPRTGQRMSGRIETKAGTEAVRFESRQDRGGPGRCVAIGPACGAPRAIRHWRSLSFSAVAQSCSPRSLLVLFGGCSGFSRGYCRSACG